MDSTGKLHETGSAAHCVGFDTHSSFVPVLGTREELSQLAPTFDLDEFQVVRREFFAHQNEPAVTFNNFKFYVNSACLLKFPEVEYIQVLINQQTKILALRPCCEGERDAFRWCTISKGRRKPRQVTGRLFFAKVISLMDWNPDFRYKLMGHVAHAKGEHLIVFDMSATEIYQRKTLSTGAGHTSTRRNPIFPAAWQEHFGVPIREHRQSLQVNIFDGYAVFSIRDKQRNPESAAQSVTESGDTDGLHSETSYTVID